MVLDAALIFTQHYKVRIKGKRSNPWNRVAPSPTHRCSRYWKGAFGSPSTKFGNFPLLYLYIYIFIYKHDLTLNNPQGLICYKICGLFNQLKSHFPSFVLSFFLFFFNTYISLLTCSWTCRCIYLFAYFYKKDILRGLYNR